MKMKVLADRKRQVRCAMVGDGLVGKTTLIKRFVHEKSADNNYVATVFDKFSGHIAVRDHKYAVTVLDTAGQQDYESLRVFTYVNCDVIVVCYSVVDRESFNNVSEFWVPEIRSYAGKDKRIALVATQTDLAEQTSSNDLVTKYEGTNLANKIGASVFLECSSHKEESITKLFENVVLSSLRKKKRKTTLVEKILGQ